MRVGMLTSGGDCQSLNATMRGVAKTLYNKVKNVEIIGFIEGYKGLMYEDYKVMTPSDFSGILTIRQALAESSNIVHIKVMKEVGPENSIKFMEKLGLKSKSSGIFPSSSIINTSTALNSLYNSSSLTSARFPNHKDRKSVV